MRLFLLSLVLMGGALWSTVATLAPLRGQAADTAYLAYVHNYRLIVGFSDGSHARPYPYPHGAIYEASYAPSGDWIAVTVGLRNDFASRLERLDVATGARRTLVSNDSGLIYYPRISPDGQYIAFVMGSHFTGTGTLYIVRSDGQQQRAIETDNYANSDPAWSPDSRSLYFMGYTVEGPRQHQRYDLDTRTVTLLQSRLDFRQGSIGPDGQQVVYNEFVTDFGTLLHIGTRDHSIAMRLTEGHPFIERRTDVMPIWSLDDGWIYYASLQGNANSFDIYRIRPDGNDETQLSDWAGNETSPTISAIISTRLRTARLIGLGAALVGGGLIALYLGRR